ncbi:enoyl-CoA hydratase-related protein [Amycolatopsis thermophila]|uniref:Enoyl-CoA hydratase/carnithine racemase n=1 Tax=Amycolatopsis thermophila TaxID=206084 RepID=A0ABU0F196_9PSEU|nr:enoyl-CoA hydratase-related protein [Amycolatopsis thermophila]MDQ0381347.1 enoyl-CoA hydratase/carnithine racemase [Amycolatopsis thermophila]
MTEIARQRLIDPGAGKRLDAKARDELSRAVREWRKDRPGAVLLEVEADAWHHAPELEGTPLEHDTVDAGYQSLVRNLFALACPVVVALDGQVSGFGLALAMTADVRAATDRTTLAVGGPAAALLGGAGWLLGHAGGGSTFAQLAWTGATLSAEEGRRRGLLAPAGDAAALAERLAADPAGSSALKRALNTPRQAELGTALGYQSWLAEVATERPS